MRARSASSGAGWWIFAAVIAAAKAATGMLRKKIARQLIASVSTPPISGPIALPSPATPSTRPPAKAARDGRDRGEGHAEDRRPHEPAAHAHADAHRDQLVGVLREAAEQREGGEDRRADEEDAPAAEHVGQPPAGDEDHPERQRVGVDRPLHGADVDVEVLLDRRQGDIERGEIVGDDEHAEAHREEGHAGPRRSSPGTCGHPSTIVSVQEAI